MLKVAGLLLLAGCTAAPQEPPGPAPVVLGYLPAWADRRVRMDRFTHLIHAFYTGAGSRGIPDRELLRAARERGVKVLLSLGGSGSGRAFRGIALEAYVRGVVAVVREGYAGVDVDWEPTEGEADRKGLVALVTALRRALGREALITMAAPATDWQGRWWDVEALRGPVDLLNVMTYDFHGPWSSHAGHHAPLRSVAEDREDGAAHSFEAGVGYWLKRGWPREKLLAGIPCYGRGFAVSRWHEKPAGKAPHESNAFREVPRLLESGWKRRWDAAALAPYLSKEGELISYEDPESAALKGRRARELGLRGVFFWSVDQDYVNEDHPIVHAASLAFFRKP